MNYRFASLDLPGLLLIEAQRRPDARGWLAEVYSETAFADAGITIRFRQDNRSHTDRAGVVRGLHFQRPPHAQAKLFWVTAGAAFNVCVDLRPAHFGQVDCRVMTAGANAAILIPEGFAHGFQSLEPNTDVHYKLSRDFHAAALDGVAWDDPDLAIGWPLPVRDDLASQRDKSARRLATARGIFA